MLNKNLIVCFISFLPTLFSSVFAQNIYSLKRESWNTFEVILRHRHSHPIRLQPPRTLKKDQEFSVVCLQTNEKFTLPVKTSCQKFRWEIPLDTKLDQDLSQQHSFILSSNQGLITEWGNFPRIDNRESMVCFEDGTCYSLPQKEQPPLMIPFGFSVYETDHFVLHTDHHLKDQEKENLIRQFERQYNQLISLMDVPVHKSKWHLIWLARDISNRSLAGFAGYQAFIANYPVDQGKLTKEMKYRLLRISTHEAFHTLEIPGDRPTWCEEALAEYFALKITNQFLSGRSAQRTWQRFQDKVNFGSIGLYEANAKVQQGEMQYYALFYTKGAAFFEKLDKLLQERNMRLNRHVKELSFDQKGHLSDHCIKYFENLFDDKFISLMERYLL